MKTLYPNFQNVTFELRKRFIRIYVRVGYSIVLFGIRYTGMCCAVIYGIRYIRLALNPVFVLRYIRFATWVVFLSKWTP